MNLFKKPTYAPAYAFFALCSTVYSAPESVVQTVTHNGETITLRLQKQDLRGANFELWTQNSDGTYSAASPVEERSYIGSVDEYPGATSCGILQDDGTFRGAVYFDRGATWFTSGSGVTGTRADWYSNFTGYQLPTTATVNPGLAGNTMYGYELGIDADHNYYTTAGSTAKALEQIEFSVCAVRAIYMRDVLLRPYLGRVILRTDQPQDPYNGLTQGNYLDRVRTEWNNNHTDTDPDLVAGVSPSKIGGGLAWVGVVGTGSGYSVSQSGGTGAFDVVFRHEMGHNWNLPHYVGGSPEGAGLMGGNQPGRFSSTEAKRLLDYRNGRMSVIDNEGTYTAVDLAPYASMDVVTVVQGATNTVTLDPVANDHDANGQVLSLIDFESNSARGGTITQQGSDLVYQAPGSYLGLDYFHYRVTDGTGNVATGVVLVDVQPGDDLRLYLTMDETSGTAIDDKSVFSKNGTLAGTDLTSSTVAGEYGNAVNFDGVDDHVWTSDVKVNSNTVTLSAWIKPGATSNPFSGIIFDRSAGVNGLNIGNSGELRYHWNDGNWAWNSGLVPAANAWTFVALVIEPDKATMYMNDGSGFQTAVNTTSHAPGVLRNIQVGRDPAQSSRYFVGAIDEVRVYNKALSQAELQDLVDGGSAESPSPFNLASDVGPVDLAWAPSASAVSYEVYMGTSESSVLNATTSSAEYLGSVTEAAYDEPPAIASTTNYWRVDVVTASGTIKGEVWSFTRNNESIVSIANNSFEDGAPGNGVPNGWNLTSSGSLGIGSGGSEGSQYLWIGPGTEITQDLSHTLVSGEELTLKYSSSRDYPRSIQLLAKSGSTYQLIGETTQQTGSSGWPTIQFKQVVDSQYNGQQLALRVISGNWNEFDNFQITSSPTPGNEAPSVSDVAFAIQENQPVSSTVGTITATDPNTNETLTYAIVDGNSGGEFAINNSTGVLITTAILDYETVSSYLLVVKVTDSGGLNDTALVSVNVTDIAYEDQDSDGMEDNWELANFGSLTASDGTNDTDGDGLSDGEEFISGSDPNNIDGDADTFVDILEVKVGTDPMDSLDQPNSSFAGLEGWWPLDEPASASTAVDYSGNALHAVVSGATFSGTEASFDGVDDYITTDPGLLNNLGAFTMSGWYRSGLTNGSRIGLWGQNDVIEFGINGNNLRVWTAGGGSASAAIPAINQWHHVVVVGDGTSLKIYINGVLTGSGGNTSSNYGSSAYSFNIGGGGIWDATGNAFTGDIKDVCVYFRAVDISEFYPPGQ